MPAFIDIHTLARDIGNVLADEHYDIGGYSLGEYSEGKILAALVPFLDTLVPGLVTETQREELRKAGVLS